MKSGALPTVVFGAFTLAAGMPAFAQHFPAALSSAVTELRNSGPVPVLLPQTIPAIVSKYGIKRAIVAQSKSGYSVSLYYSEQTSDATFAGMVAGSTVTLSQASLPGTTSMSLTHGTRAFFVPVSCGGSCAPANLWWQVGKFKYQLQLQLRSDLSKERQQQALAQMANSMAPVH